MALPANFSPAHRRVMREIEADQVAVLIAPYHQGGRQKITSSQCRARLASNLQPHLVQVRGDGIQGAFQVIIVEPAVWNPQLE